MRTLKSLFAAALVCLPMLAHAATQLVVPCKYAPQGFVTRSQVESGLRSFQRCSPIFERMEPTCSDDGQHCVCPNVGPVKDWVICAEDLINDCESQAGCSWWQDVDGDVNCLCNAPINLD